MGETRIADRERIPGIHGPEDLVDPSVWTSGWLEAGIAILDGKGAILQLDEHLQTWLGLSQQDLAGKSFFDLLKERCPPWAATLDELSRSTEPIQRLELTVPHGLDASARWFSLEAAHTATSWFVRLSSSLPPGRELSETGWDSQWVDRAAGKELFLRVLRSEAQLERLTRYWPGVIFTQRPDFRFQSVTGKIEELTGRSPAGWMDATADFWASIHEGDVAELRHQVDLSVETRQSVTSRFRVRNAGSGRVNYVLEHRQPIVSGTGLLVGYEAVWLDVTRQTLAEKLLTSAAWKETLGVLTMGLAHDFSNVMAGIHSLSESFLSQVEEGHPFRDGLGLIRKSSLQASQLVHRIVNLHLGKPGERNYHDLNQIIRELLELVRKVIPRRIEIAMELHAGVLPVYIDAFEFRQVIINLALNASDAMPGSGRLLLRTSRATELSPDIHYHGIAPRTPAVCLTIQDSGCGVEAAHRDLIFDPFFTTKCGGKGTGLGLYNARLFAEKNRGAIWLESEEGQGASFTVGLPEANFSEAESSSTTVGPGARRALLLYGPASALFDETARMLRSEGYHVATAHTLERAEGFFAAGDCTYGAIVLLTDSTGMVLAPHIVAWRRSHPALKVVLRPLGRTSDDLDADLVRLADMVVTPELSPGALMEKLKSTLTGDKRG